MPTPLVVLGPRLVLMVLNCALTYFSYSFNLAGRALQSYVHIGF